ncbi:MAG: type II toxin-antitoxin system HicB family antitoxin [Rhizobiales bacterium]|nr:type II toxin-antitoxin system HicB family antitoxin [Hyphomicrobiales bacterium]
MDASWSYGINIDKKDGDFVVSARDLPEVVTSGGTFDEALALARDAIELAVTGRMEDGMNLTPPTLARKGEHIVSLPAQLAAKASIYSAWKAAGLSKMALARLLERNEAEVRRILNPRHATKLDQLEEAANALGGRLNISFESL